MDISEIYIKMRLAAIPDLGMGISIESPCNLIANDVWVDSKGDWYYATMDRVIQLERQDQLQGMYYTEAIKERYLTSKVRHLCLIAQRFEVMEGQNFTSMEQLWLAIVQKTPHNKVWNGDTWEVYNG